MNDPNGTPDVQTPGLQNVSSATNDAWKRTLDEMQELADAKREDGWEVTTVMAAHTDPVTPDMGDDPDRFGLVHVVPDNYADEFTAAYDDAAFTDYLAYGNTIDGSMFLVTELIDPDDDRSILVASSFEVHRYRPLMGAVRDEGTMYSHFETIDGTTLETFEHEEYEALVPE